jgi:Ser/Thr protein kinase RdoA (MazF antagonist)
VQLALDQLRQSFCRYAHGKHPFFPGQWPAIIEEKEKLGQAQFIEGYPVTDNHLDMPPYDDSPPPPAEILQRYCWAAPPAAQFLGSRGGFSGARIWRLDAHDGPRCLKCWPADGISADRLVWIHALLRQGRAAGLTFLPQAVGTHQGATVVAHAGRLWDVTTWMPGNADFPRQPSPARLQAACTALAQLHLAWTPQPMPLQPCAGVRRCLEALQAAGSLRASGWTPPLQKDDPLGDCALGAWRLLGRHIDPAVDSLRPWLDVALPAHPCWCDPWHGNLLFSGELLTGLIDHGSVKQDHAAVDLARLLGSLLGDDRARWQTGIQAYCALRPLSDREVLLVSLLEQAGLLAAAANWLRWLYHERRAYPDPGAVAERLAEIAARLSALH